jgi:hypothetical protein
MSSPPPPEPPQPQPSTSDGVYEPEPDDEDTGPLRVSEPSPPVHDDWNSAPAQSTWAGRFDAPLTVSPRQVQAPRKRSGSVIGAAAVVAVALIGGVVFWLLRPSSDTAGSQDAEPTTSAPAAEPTPTADEARLQRLLPTGYPPDACQAADTPKDTLAQLNCEKNTDIGGPLSATYTLAKDKAGLDAAFNAAVQTADRVNCPGNIQSPGPWRRNATPDKVSGMLFCGMREGQPTVIWTDDAKLVVSAVQSGPQGPTLPQLYAWWSSHS